MTARRRVQTVLPGLWTCFREVGGLGIYLARAVAEGVLDGPAVYAAGAVLSTTGGHGDLHCYPLSWMEEFARTDGTFRLADGTAECMRAVREQLRRGAAVIKVCASGGVLSDLDDPIHQQFTDAELRAIVEVAGLADRVVAAHCHGKPGIMAALAAGVATIIAQRHADAMALAIERGVTIAMGTDIGLTGLDRPNAWGTNGSELAHLVTLGLTPLQAIEAATATAPRTLGPQAPRSGLLAAGYDADLITVDGDPLADISVLARPAAITGVWSRGRQVQGAGIAA